MEINGKLCEGLSYFSTHENPKIGYKDANGNLVIPQQFHEATDFSCGLCLVGLYNTKGVLMCGFINTKGEIVIPLIYHSATSFKKQGNLIYAKVQDETGKFFYINHTGERISRPFNSIKTDSDKTIIQKSATLCFKTLKIAEKNLEEIKQYYGDRLVSSIILEGIDERGNKGFYVQFEEIDIRYY